MMEAIWQHLDPVIEHLGTLDLSDGESVARSLTEKFGDLPELQQLCRDHLEELCHIPPTSREARCS